MPTLELPKVVQMQLDEKGRLSCAQATDTMKEPNSIDAENRLRVVMATLCHYQCDSRAS